MKTVNFKKLVQAMTAKEIIMAMVNGLRNNNARNLEINMSAFAELDEGVCCGCAATASILEICDVEAEWQDLIEEGAETLQVLGNVILDGKDDYEFLSNFENAINELRQGDITYYNVIASIIGIAKIKQTRIVPYLYSSDYFIYLDEYEKLAEEQI